MNQRLLRILNMARAFGPADDNGAQAGGGADTGATTSSDGDAASGAPPEGGSQNLSPDDMEMLMMSDPFNPDADDEGEETQPEGSTEGSEGQDPAQTQPEAQPGQEAPPKPETAQNDQSQTIAALQQQISTLMTQIQSMQTGGQGQGGDQQQQAPSESPFEKVPGYDFSIPDGLVELLNSEDPKERTQGIAAFGKGVSQVVHKTIMGEMGGVIQQVVEAIPQMVAQINQQTETQKSIFDDFYGTFKDLNRKELYPTIQTVTQQVLSDPAYGGQWSAAARDEIGKRVYALMGRAAPGGQQQQQTSPPKIHGGGNSGTRPTPGKTEGQDIVDTLGFF